MENVLVAERLNDSVEVANKQLYVHSKLDIILHFAIFVTIVGTILFHICSNLVWGYSVYLQEARTRII